MSLLATIIALKADLRSKKDRPEDKEDKEV